MFILFTLRVIIAISQCIFIILFTPTMTNVSGRGSVNIKSPDHVRNKILKAKVKILKTETLIETFKLL